MTWHIIRRATDEDKERLERTLRDFIEKYVPELSVDACHGYVMTYIDLMEDRNKANRLKGILMKRVRRALKTNEADGIAWGNVGYHTEE